MISSLIDDSLLRSVRTEIRENVHFTPKETDIYKIHQSGDLANLDSLDNAALEKLPSLLRLRDALYSSAFRKYVATITGSGELSGRKTDMAINIYTPGCHLLCHDNVIGSRRVSYILYLTDPDMPWKEEWGGALRLYPTTSFEEEDGQTTKTPSPDFTKVIPPAWNQLSFFAVQPGESFHDVEEVYHAHDKEQLEKDGGRVRMAISGWYHIPQIGEDGYVKGAEESFAAKSSLIQLQGNPDQYDFPQLRLITVEAPTEPDKEKSLSDADLDFLLKYMAPTYLTPDTMELVTKYFMEHSSVTLDDILSKKFSTRLREYVKAQEKSLLPESSVEIEKNRPWKVARPPHKHRFLYIQPASSSDSQETDVAKDLNPIEELLEVFLPSREFQQWLELATECEIENYDIMARRFRKGADYALATSHDGKTRLEISLGLTPTLGWEADDEEEGEEEGDGGSGEETGGSKAKDKMVEAEKEEEKDDDVGGHEVFMAADEDETSGGDAAIYKTTSDAEDDNILFSMSPSWNKMSIVLRDSGVLKFVKYVSRKAKGDRWDIAGAFGVKDIEDDDEGNSIEDGDSEEVSQPLIEDESSTDTEFNNGFRGFSEETDSDSD